MSSDGGELKRDDDVDAALRELLTEIELESVPETIRDLAHKLQELLDQQVSEAAENHSLG